ncbi:carboxymuconolactone decarboxylase family protein [Prauserella cavernicola]|uniref:Carboxymuconolactone decarboxylase family protein n=1 Tax=Prauserella cavernicola TaxID=2800127 RepID=A0A934V979_9PSEU|nr:carboxymuconolactone decarboxylase family protein [Prauserella cavernicola]MBK1789444.1 carboxymuconolactone decarboxylase family protein [Prauserella cavernicola]
MGPSADDEPRVSLRTSEETARAVTGNPPVAPFTARRTELAVYRVLANSPRLLDAWLPLCDYFLEAPGLTAYEREVLILRTANNCDSRYEWDKHEPKAAEAGISEADLTLIRGESPPGEPTTWLHTLLAFADELHRHSTVTDATWAAIRERLDEAQALNCLMLVGQYHMLAFALNGAALTVEPD